MGHDTNASPACSATGTGAGPAWQAFVDANSASGDHDVIVPLPPAGSTDRRLILWRATGPDFSDRDVQLLTLRQWEVLRMVADGATNGLIARRLGLSEATVRMHLENTFARLGVTNRTAAVGRTQRYLRAG